MRFDSQQCTPGASLKDWRLVHVQCIKQPCPPAGQPIRVLIVMVKLHPITFECCRVYLIPPPIPLVSSGHNFYIDVCGGGSSSGGLVNWYSRISRPNNNLAGV